MVHLISQHSCRAWQFILPSPRGRSPSYSVEPITANTRATAPDMPARSAGTNHHGGGVSFLSMITLPLSNRRYAWCCKAPANRLIRSLARPRPVRRSEEHTSAFKSLMRISDAACSLENKTQCDPLSLTHDPILT